MVGILSAVVMMLIVAVNAPTARADEEMFVELTALLSLSQEQIPQVGGPQQQFAADMDAASAMAGALTEEQLAKFEAHKLASES